MVYWKLCHATLRRLERLYTQHNSVFLHVVYLFILHIVCLFTVGLLALLQALACITQKVGGAVYTT